MDTDISNRKAHSCAGDALVRINYWLAMPSRAGSYRPMQEIERVPGERLTNDQLLHVYAELNATRLDYNERKWETVKSSSVLVLGLLAAVGGLAQSEKIKAENGFLFLGLTTIFVGYWVYRWTLGNLKRESELQYHVEFPMYQIERMIGLHGVIPREQRWLQTADRLFGGKHTSVLFGVDEHFRATMGGSDQRGEDADRAIHAWVQARLSHHRFVDTVGGYSLLLLVACGAFGFYLCWLDARGWGLFFGAALLAICRPLAMAFERLNRVVTGR